MKQYSMFIPWEDSSADIWNLTQKQAKSLWAYIDMFKSIASQVSMDEGEAIEMLRWGLWYECRFYDTLSYVPPAILEDVLHRATIYIKIKEECEAFHKLHTTTRSSSFIKEKKIKEAKDQYYEPR